MRQDSVDATSHRSPIELRFNTRWCYRLHPGSTLAIATIRLYPTTWQVGKQKNNLGSVPWHGVTDVLIINFQYHYRPVVQAIGILDELRGVRRT